MRVGWASLSEAEDEEDEDEEEEERRRLSGEMTGGSWERSSFPSRTQVSR